MQLELSAWNLFIFFRGWGGGYRKAEDLSTLKCLWLLQQTQQQYESWVNHQHKGTRSSVRKWINERSLNELASKAEQFNALQACKDNTSLHSTGGGILLFACVEVFKFQQGCREHGTRICGMNWSEVILLSKRITNLIFYHNWSNTIQSNCLQSKCYLSALVVC